MIMRIRGVKRVRSRGRIYYYHRRTMTRLPGDPGSPEFMAKLGAMNSRREGAAAPGSLGGLIALYRKSPEFSQRSDRTRGIYDSVFEYLRPLSGMPLFQIEPSFLYGVRDKAAEQRRRFHANMTITVLRLLFSWGMRRGYADRNPAVAVELITRAKNAPIRNRPWRPEEMAVVMSEAPAWMRVAIALGAYAGLRLGDMIRMTWMSYDGSTIQVRQQKTNYPVWVPAHADLRAILDAAPRTSPVILVGAKGAPFANRVGFQSQFFKLLQRLKAEGKIGSGLSFHGLRHTFAVALDEQGIDPRTIADLLGQRSIASQAPYIRGSNRRGLAGAAIAKLERGTK